MALENVGIAAVVRFSAQQAISGMRQLGTAAQAMGGAMAAGQSGAQRLGGAIDTIGRSARQAAMALAPLAGAFGFAVHDAAAYEKQMDAVLAMTDANKQEMQELSDASKKWGLSSKFDPTEIGKGMESLAVSGFKANQIMDAMPALISAASIEGTNLHDTARVMTDVIHGMGLEASDATRVADVLALASSRTSTTMSELGQGFHYAAANARTLGMSLETTSAMLAVAADAGLHGTHGGTNLASALKKLADPSEAATDYMKQMGITMTKTADGAFDAVDVFQQVNTALKKYPDNLQRVAIAQEIFGTYGQKAFSAIGVALDKMGEEGVDKVRALTAELENAQGVAAKMAAIKMDNLLGRWQLFQSAVKVFNIEVGGQFLEPLTNSIGSMTTFVQNVTTGFVELNKEGTLSKETFEKIGPIAAAVATGVKKGIDDIKNAWAEWNTQLGKTHESLGGKEGVIEDVTRFTVVATGASTVLVPLLLGLSALIGIGKFLWGVMTALLVPLAYITELFLAIPGPGWVIAAILAAIAFGFWVVSDSAQWFRDLMVKIGQNVYDIMIQPIIDGLAMLNPYWEYLSDAARYAWDSIVESTMETVNLIWGFFEPLVDGFMFIFWKIYDIGVMVFQKLVEWTAATFGLLAAAVGTAFQAVLWVVQGIVTVIEVVIFGVIHGIITGIKALSGAIGKAVLFMEPGSQYGKDLVEWSQTPNFWEKSPNGPSTDRRDNMMSVIPEDQSGPMSVADEANAWDLMSHEGNANLGDKVADAIKANPPKQTANVKVCIDGKKVGQATAKFDQELHDRAGFKQTPWQKQNMAEQGAQGR